MAKRLWMGMEPAQTSGIVRNMAELLQQAMDALRRLPAAEQDAYARALLEALPDPGGVYELSDEVRAAIDASKAQAKRGEFVSETDIMDFWRKVSA